MNNESSVWRFFNRDVIKKSAKCSIANCKNAYKLSGGSTKSLWDHLERKHHTEYLSIKASRKRRAYESQEYSELLVEEDNDVPLITSTSKQPKILNFFLLYSNKLRNEYIY